MVQFDLPPAIFYTAGADTIVLFPFFSFSSRFWNVVKGRELSSNAQTVVQTEHDNAHAHLKAICGDRAA